MHGKFASYIVTAFGLAVLMIVHETGHLMAARRFGLRVVKFSVGFGPVLWRRQPAGSSTVYQVALIPFLAYVQIAGMNPYEENDPADTGSYANAPIWARCCTIAAGPLSNYFFASILMFAGFMLGGHKVVDEAGMHVSVVVDGPAYAAKMQEGDRIVSVNGESVADWDQLKKAVGAHAGDPITVVVERDKTSLELHMSPKPKGDVNAGKILIKPQTKVVHVTMAQAALLSVTEPPKVVYDLVRGLERRVTGKEDLEFLGPVGIFKMTSEVVRTGASDTLEFLGVLSAYLGGFNLLPFPALDGGRLIFLAVEATSRRRADAKVEAGVHALGLLMMLGFIGFLTYTGR
jgi:regulator of sigma E protease